MAWFEDYTRANQTPLNTSLRNRVLTWSPPLPHTLKINVDGVFSFRQIVEVWVAWSKITMGSSWLVLLNHASSSRCFSISDGTLMH